VSTLFLYAFFPAAVVVSDGPHMIPHEYKEIHAGYVEDNMLAQVRTVCAGQEIDVWVLGRTRVRFRIGKTSLLFLSDYPEIL
jgi:hypothetical protein